MLKSSKSINFNGRSLIDDKPVATFNANVYEDAGISNGNDSINMVVVDNDLYNENRNEVRKDLQDFQKLVWNAQDELVKDSNKDIKK